MKTNFLTFTLMCFVCGYSYAQNTFKVITASGGNINFKNEKTNTLKIGEGINANDQITVGGYVALSYQKGGTVQISKVGTYKVSELEANLLKSKQSATQKYASLVIGEIVKNGDVDTHKNPYKYQKVTGSVERAISSGKKISTFVTKRFKDKYNIALNKEELEATCNIKLIATSNAEIKSFEQTTETFLVDFNDEKLKTQPIVTIEIEAKGKNSARQIIIKKPKAQDVKKVKAELDELKNNNKNAEFSSAELKLQEAVIWENQGFELEAMEAYKEAKNLNEEDEIFTIAYNQFLMRKGFKSEE